MKTSLSITLAVLVALLAMSLHCERRLTALRTEQEKLVTRAITLGFSPDPHTQERTIPRQKPERSAPKEEAKRVAASLAAYAADFPVLGEPDSHAWKTRMAIESAKVLALDGSELKALVAELREDDQISRTDRDRFLSFALQRLLRTHPEEALAVLLDEPRLSPKDGSWPPQGLFPEAIRSWSRIDPHAARDWLEQNRGNVPDFTGLWRGLIDGALVGDPELALELVRSSGEGIESLSYLVDQNHLGSQERLALLASLRRLPTPAFRTVAPGHAVLSALAFGGREERPTPFIATTRHLLLAKFSPDELDILTLSGIENLIDPEETSLWLDWLEQVPWPEPYPERLQAGILQGHRTAIPAGRWLEQRPRPVEAKPVSPAN